MATATLMRNDIELVHPSLQQNRLRLGTLNPRQGRLIRFQKLLWGSDRTGLKVGIW
jgi:hypothetical protein